MEQYYSIIGAAILGIVGLGLFATKADVERLRSDISRDFVTKHEVEKICDKLDNLTSLVLSMKGKDV